MIADESLSSLLKEHVQRGIQQGSSQEFLLSSEETGVTLVKDTDHAIIAFRNGREIGVAGVSFGLEKYYFDHDLASLGIDNSYIPQEIAEKLFNPAKFFGRNPEPYIKAIRNIGENPVIVQFQAAFASASIRKGTSWKNMLVKTWEKILLQNGFDELYFLPASLNKWLICSVQDTVAYMETKFPTVEELKYNYDFVARRNKFSMDSETGLYLKRLIN